VPRAGTNANTSYWLSCALRARLSASLARLSASLTRLSASFVPRAAILAILCADTYYGRRMLLLSMVTASRAKALPDRLAAVFIVMLE